MKKVIAIGVPLCLVVAVVLLGAYHQAVARGYGSPNGPLGSARWVSPAILSSAHTLLASKFDQGELLSVVGSGFVKVDAPITFVCSKTTGCTIGAEHWLQVGNSTASSNVWAICTYIDGGIRALCPHQGTIPSDGSFTTGSFSLSAPVSMGSHTVQEVLYTSSGAEIGDYHNDYRLYAGE
jgi:hypothetical protein